MRGALYQTYQDSSDHGTNGPKARADGTVAFLTCLDNQSIES